MKLPIPCKARFKCRDGHCPEDECPASNTSAGLKKLLCTWALLIVVISSAYAERSQHEAKEPQVSFDVKVISIPSSAHLKILADAPTEKGQVTVWSVSADALNAQIQLLLTESGATILSMPRVVTALGQKVEIESKQDGNGDSFAGTRYGLLPRIQGNGMEVEIDVEHVSRVDQNARIHTIENIRNGDSVLLRQRQPADNKSGFPLFMVTPVWNGPGSDMRARLQQIILPSVQFSEASLEEALEFFRIKSRTLYVGEESGRQGLNLVLNVVPAPATSIDLHLANIPLIEALKYTAILADLDLHVDDNAVVFRAKVPSKKEDAIPGISKPEARAAQNARRFIRPQVQFSGASLEEALEFLRAPYACNEGMENRHVNFILKQGGKAASISLDLKDVSVWDAVRYIAEQSDHTVSADDYSIILSPR